MRLVISNRVISEPIINILRRVRSETEFLKDIFERGQDVVCTCPFHSDGHEKKPACYVKSDQSSKLEYGTFHCFSCGQSGSLAKLIGKCYNESTEFGNRWLVENYGNTYLQEVQYLPPLIDNTTTKYLDESYLDQFEYDNDCAINYLMNNRHISRDVIDKFQLGYDKSDNSITFPLRDEHGKLLGVTKRCIDNKRFNIPKIDNKPIYLLYDVIKSNPTFVVVCESQINALTIRSWGMSSIALFGTGSKYQYNLLNKSGIRNYLLAFDGDLAGDIGANKFSTNIFGAVISQVVLPRGKDVNDLTMDEFLSLPIVNR